MKVDSIKIFGARQNNLKNINVTIPRDKLVVITGVSGSGKSSLAFDTIYSEGQRRYIESLSSYARQFIDSFDKPDVDHIDGLSPAIAIEQKTTSKNPRSTVGTMTEIYDFLRLLYARVGIPYSPATGLPIEKQSIDTMVAKILQKAENTKAMILAPIARDKKGEFKKEIEELAKQGFQRVNIDGEIYEIEEVPPLNKNKKHNISVVIDRIVISKEIETRINQSLELALNLGGGVAILEDLTKNEKNIFSEKFACPVSGFAIEEIEPKLFSFNSPFGACNICNGLGVEAFFDIKLIVPDTKKPLGEAIMSWESDKGYYAAMLKSLANHFGVKLSTPFRELKADFLEKLLYGTKEKIALEFKTANHTHNISRSFEGIMNNFARRINETQSDTIREELSKLQKVDLCSSCQGMRLNQKALQVKINKKNIMELTNMDVEKLIIWFENISLSKQKEEIAKKIINEIKERLSFLKNVGIGYLTLSRSSSTLSGGEGQRIRLASQIGSGLSGVLYILDEPSIGLHQKDNDRLISTLLRLKDLDNTVIVVEHDEDTMNASDYIIDIGPGAGVLGGQIIAEGTPEELKNDENSITGQYLSGIRKIEVPSSRRQGSGKKITIKGAKKNNLKNIDVELPLGKFNCITGVSGSGKSTLINQILKPAVSNSLNRKQQDIESFYKSIEGVAYIDKMISIDQSPIGRTPRSNPATYVGVFDDIRALFVALPEAKEKSFKPGRFSFNVKGGRCEHCKGDGYLKIEMNFLPDVFVKCEECKGKRYNKETLTIKWKGYSIADILGLNITEALTVFEAIPSIKNKLQSLIDVGLEYITLGQSAITLSGGEAQRIKLSKELSKRSTGQTLYILDEPTTGLHFQDIEKLLKVLNTLANKGNTLVIIEHNLDVIKNADHIIDIGPEGGDKGGKIIATGTPEEVAQNKKSYTGVYLKKILG